MKARRCHVIIALAAVLALCSGVHAQTETPTGIPPFSSLTGGPDAINLSNLNINWTIPIVKKAGRGMNFSYSQSYNSSIWFRDVVNGYFVWNAVENYGWRGTAESSTGSLSYSEIFYPYYQAYNFKYNDPTGAQHALWLSFDGTTGWAGDGTSSDGSGYKMEMQSGAPTFTMITPSGAFIVAPANSPTITTGGITDSNGNKLNNDGTDFTDTLGTTALTATVVSAAETDLTYHTPTGTAMVKLNYTQKGIRTNFGCTGVGEYSTTGYLLTSIVYPDNSSYQITYEPTPGYSTNVTGRVASVTLPTGGTVSYSYTGSNHGIDCGDGSTAGLERITPDTPYDHWTYSRSYLSTTVTDPAGNQTVTDFETEWSGTLYEIKKTEKDNSAAVLRTTVTCYNATTPAVNCSNSGLMQPFTRKTVFTQLPNSSGLTSEVDTHYSNALVTDVYEYDYGTGGSAGSLLRHTETSYASLGSNIIDHPYQVTVKDGSNTVQAQTTYTYDYGTPSTTSAPQHVSPPSSPYRGNPTTISRWLSTTNSNLSTTLTYDDTGNVLTSTDPGGHTTTYTYASGVAYGFPTQTQYPDTNNGSTVHHIESAAYDINTGLKTSSTDQNNNITCYSYDNELRPTAVTVPQASSCSGTNLTTWSYGTSPFTVTRTQNASPNPDQVMTTTYDGLGRVSQTQQSDPEGDVLGYVFYDTRGRKYIELNPGRIASSATDGDTTYLYDPLNRLTSITKPDGGQVTSSYTGSCTTVSDETGRPRKSCSDALGRVTQVIEPNPSSGSLTSGAYETLYAYNTLDNLTTVTQKGGSTNSGDWRARTFSYDSLSRLTSASNPESGTVTYSYAAVTDCAGDSGPCSKTDARNITMNYKYDSLHRLTANGVTGEPWAGSNYDLTTEWGDTISNPIGRVVTHNIGGGAPAQRFQYDAMGRVIEQKDCFAAGAACVTTTAGYDVAGQMAWLQYPSGRKIAYAYQSSGRPETVTFERFGSDVFNYTYWTADHYHPNGALKQSTLGSGVVETALYNNRLQPTELTVGGSQTWADHVYHYLDGGSHNNGNVMQIDDQLNSGRTQSFGYDWLNRIGNAATTATSGPDAWAQTYTIDPWGNLLEIAGYHPFCVSNASNTPNNRLGVLCSTGVQMHTYDSSGNMTWDGVHNYGYDSEGRIKTVDTTAATYIYGPGGERVRKEVGSDATDYVIFNGQTIAEHAPNGDWSDYVYAGSKRIVRADDHEDFIRTTGNCTSCGSQWADFSLGTAGYSGYVIQSGDKIFFRQWQANGGRGGLLITAGSASSASLNDQDGIPLNADTYSNTWHFRRADLSSLAGNALSSISMRAEGPSGSGWTVDFREIVLVSTDGTVKPIYTRQPSVSVTTTSSSGMSSLSAQVIHWGSPRPEGAPLYYHGDHLGSARLLSGYSGYPIATYTYGPYGEEFNPQTTVNHYKFTGKERDSESGLDNFGARYHGSNLGRFMTPDPENAGAEPDDPQSWNGYAYARNNPLQMIDPSGLAYCSITPAQDEDTCTEAGGTWNYEGGDPQTLKNEAGDEAEIATPSTEVTVDGDTEEVYTVNFNFSNDRPLSSTARDTFTQVGVQTGNITKQMNCVAGAIYPFIPGVHPEDMRGLLLDTMGSALGIGAEENAARAESLRTGYKLGAGRSAMRRNAAAASRISRAFKIGAGTINGLNLALAAMDGYKNFKQCESQP